ncbi:uncharacterized protein LOC142327312 [Lycorma delicatula]|uniref:uncharacterized protein LOC142327312 n=1 Tax=Lycorma delicatula TaxID=130591 RepID=UPI003F50E420
MKYGRLILFAALCVVCCCEENDQRREELQNQMYAFSDIYLHLIKFTTPFSPDKSSCMRCMEEYIKYEIDRIKNLIDADNVSESSTLSFKNIKSNFIIFSNTYRLLTKMCIASNTEESNNKLPDFDDTIKNIGLENFISGDSTEGLQKCISTFLPPIKVDELKMIENLYKNGISITGLGDTDDRSDQSKNYCFACIKSFIIYESKRVQFNSKLIIRKQNIEEILPGDRNKYILAQDIVANYIMFMKYSNNWEEVCNKNYPKNSETIPEVDDILNGIGINYLIDNGRTEGMNKCIKAFVNPAYWKSFEDESDENE